MYMHKFTRTLLLVVALSVPFFTKAQTIENVKVSSGVDKDGINKYFFTYDLIAPHANIPCLVKVKLTSGTRSFYIELIKGDVGNLVLPGKGKRFAWDFEEELINFSGAENKFAFEVYPNITVPAKVKRNKKLSVKMDDILVKDKHYTYILFRHEKEVITLTDMPLTQNAFSLSIPRKTKARNDYQLCITDGELKYFSNTFKVKPVVSNFWKVLPFLLVPAYIMGQGYLEENKELPGVPDSPTN